MNINTVQFVNSSDLFKKISEQFNIDADDFAGGFSDACTSVSYGDASHTMINMETFLSIIVWMEHSFTLVQIEEIRSWLLDGVMIDLES